MTTVKVTLVTGPIPVDGDHPTKLIDGRAMIVCICGEKAVWNSSGKTERFYCADHVPRGDCNCNDYSGELNARHPLTERRLDDCGRDLPCVDYWYDPDGYESRPNEQS